MTTLVLLGIFAIVIGAALSLACNVITSGGITVAAGIVFMLVGLINMLFPGKRKDGEPQHGIARFFALMSDVASIVLGASMLVFTHTFAGIISFVFGVVLAFAALWQFIFLISYAKSTHRLPAWLYIFPIAITAGAVYIFMLESIAADPRIMLVTGIALMVLGVGVCIESALLGIYNRRDAKARATSTTPGVIEQTVPVTADTTEHQTIDFKDVHPVVQTQPRQKVETTEDLDDENR